MFRDKGTTGVLLVSGVLFFALGLLAAIGPTLPELARNNGVSLAAAGSIFTALFLGAIPAEIMTGWLTDRFGTRLVLLAGVLVLGAGLLGATLSRSLPLTLGCMLFGGLGDGVLIVGANVLVAQSFTKRTASALNLFNVFYGVGAIIGPAIAGATIAIWGSALPSLWGLVIVLVVLAPAIAALRVPDRIKPDEGDAPTPGPPLYRSHILWLFSFLLFLYVGIEVGTGGWIATYMQRTAQIIPETAALVASGYYLALTAGRVAAAGLGTKLSSERLLLVSIVGAVLGGVVVLASVGNSTVTITGFLLLGASLGPIFPTVVALLTAHFPVNAGRAASMAIASGSAGGTLIPLLQGALLENVGAEALALLMVADTFAMLMLLGLSRAVVRGREAGSIARAAPGSPAVE